MKNVFRGAALLAAVFMAACGGSGGSDNLAPGGGTPPPTGGGTPEIAVSDPFPSMSFSQPTALKQAPGDASRWFVSEKAGVIRVFSNNPNSSSSSVFLDISAVTAGFGEGGLLGFAFHPDFPVTPEVFEAFLPYAYALDVENKWCDRFAREMPRDVRDSGGYNPAWYSGRLHGAGALHHLGDNFSSTFSSAIASASTPPGSSSGGGGGGFSGGGCGGGCGGTDELPPGNLRPIAVVTHCLPPLVVTVDMGVDADVLSPALARG